MVIVTLLYSAAASNFSPSPLHPLQDYLGHVGSPGRVERQVPRGLSGLQGNVRCPRDQPSVPSDQRAGYLRQPTHPSPSTVCC